MLEKSTRQKIRQHPAYRKFFPDSCLLITHRLAEQGIARRHGATAGIAPAVGHIRATIRRNIYSRSGLWRIDHSHFEYGSSLEIQPDY